MKRFLLIVLLVWAGVCRGQNPHYDRAFSKLAEMVALQRPISFERAVYEVERAGTGGTLDYGAFKREIQRLTVLAQEVAKSRELDYEGEDISMHALKAAVHTVITDTITFEVDGRKMVHLPFSYDFDDPGGKQDWEQMFVAKLLETGSGNCHSLPYLYKIVSDRLGVDSRLALAPAHVYIKSSSSEYGWYNTELTSGVFPNDAWIMASTFTHLDGVRNRLFMNPLTQKGEISLCLTDLAEGYKRQIGFGDGKFIENCCSLALRAAPNNINALLMLAETRRLQLRMAPTSPQGATAGASSDLDELTALYDRIHRLGYRRLPDRMQADWIERRDRARRGLPALPETNKNPTDPDGHTILTLSKGKYDELHDRDSIVRIGKAMFNVVASKIVGHVDIDSVFGDDELIDHVPSRWLSPDPLAKEFPSWSPYVYVNNNPIRLVDVDGLFPAPAGLPPVYDPDGRFSTLTKKADYRYVFLSVQTSNNTSAAHLQKLAWAYREDRRDYIPSAFGPIKGAIGEAIVLEQFITPDNLNNTTAMTHLKNMAHPLRNAIARFHGRNQEEYTLHPDKFTDLEMTTKLDGLRHEFWGYNVLGGLTTGGVFHPANTTFVYEIKTNKSDVNGLYTSQNIGRGVQQLLLNSKVKAGGIPILIMDQEYFMTAWKTDPDAVKDAMRKLGAKNGGIYTIEGLNSDAIQKMGNLNKEIRESSKEPPENYYNYDN